MPQLNLNELVRIIIISAMLMVALGVAQVRAEEKLKPTCEKVLAACDLYVIALKDQKRILMQSIAEQDQRIADLESQVAPTAWYWYVLGGAATAIVANEVLR